MVIRRLKILNRIKRIMPHRWASKVMLLLVLSVFSTAAWAAQGLTFNLTPGVTPISRDIYELHMIILWICVGIGAIVFSVLIYALVKHRKSKGHVAAKFHGNAKLEIVWSVIPLLILVVMAVPATKVLIRMSDDSKADLNIKVTGYQWKWEYQYLDEGISFFSNLSTPAKQITGKEKKGKWYLLEVDNPLVVPIHKKIRFLVTSNDVIHSWWVPALGIKRDAIPGFIHEAWARIERPGVYRGQCAELCGVKHAFMPIVVVAKTQADYQQWVKEQRMGKEAAAQAAKAAADKVWSKAELMSKGEQVYNQYCAACHQASGKGIPPTFPALIGAPITTGPVNPHINIVLNGKSGTGMQAFKAQLNDIDIAAVVTYERNAWGNDNKAKYGAAAGGVVQPTDVAKQRK